MNTIKKIALVTGGSRGLGKNMAINLAKNGNDVVLTYHSNKDEADKVVAEIKDLGQNAVAFQLDAGNIKSFDKFIQEVTSYLYERTVAYTNETELRVVANDLEACEKYRLSLLPPRRRTIYAMSRFEDKSISDISAELNLSHRTVENHLRIGRHEVREFIKQCI